MTPTASRTDQLSRPPRAKSGLVKRFRAATAQINTATINALDERHPWFKGLDAESRSWISMVARSGIDGFTTWLSGREFAPESVFEVAPRLMARRISLRQTVDLVRTTTEVVESQIEELMPRSDREALHLGVLQYSREIAFAAATIYARAAEARGAWDSRIEASVIDAVVRGEADEAVLSRASALGWDNDWKVTVAIAQAHEDPDIEGLRRAAAKSSLELLAAPQGERMVCIFGGQAVTSPVATCTKIGELRQYFGDSPLVVGPIVDSLAEAAQSAREAASGYRAARAWPEGPSILLAEDLLPERALSGDGHARRTLGTDVYGSLAKHPELLETTVTFLDNGSSMEATARAMFVHPNTVRYRLKRITEITGYNPTNAREAYILRLAITLGRLQTPRRQSLA